MTILEFKATVNDLNEPPFDNSLLQALWYDVKGDWQMAHAIAQDINTEDGSWIHAYLHRKEGDEGNASYWYRRAHRILPNVTLDEECDNLLAELLTR